MTRVKVTLREPTPEERRALERLASSDTAQARFAAARGVRLPTEVRGVPEPDRAVVEGAAELSVEGTTLRDVGEGLSRGRGGDGLLEPAPPSVRLGPTPSPSAPPPPGRRRRGVAAVPGVRRLAG